MKNIEKIRNFSIIAHIDHGKSTLADRLIEMTGSLTQREMKSQVLDSMDIERERGITIKAQTARLIYQPEKNGPEYILNLIDTPGHVDFSYEVSRSLAACEGVLLIIDASQGIEAQTIATLQLAMENDLVIIPVINKIDLPAADTDSVRAQIEDFIGIDGSEALPVSAKEGTGVKEILDAIVDRIPAPECEEDSPLRALLVDSWYDSYRGVICLIRIFDGHLTAGKKIRFLSTGKEYELTSIGVFTPKEEDVKTLGPGEVGFINGSIKTIADTQVGDTVTESGNLTVEPLSGFKAVKSMVFSGLYPIDSSQYEPLRDALEKLKLNDSGLEYEPESSLALGFGFRCGCLGLLHMDIIRERLEREFSLDLISTAPTVVYEVLTVKGEVLRVDNPASLPPVNLIDKIKEPYISTTIILPDEYLGSIMGLVQEKRGIQKNMEYIGKNRVMIEYEMPLNEIVIDFYDKLKSISRGYASMDYEVLDFRPANLVKLDVSLNGDMVDSLSMIVHRDKAYKYGRDLAARLKEIIPRQMYEVAIQASLGSRIIARETIGAMRKNVTAKCYGGDITRKRKLLEKQKEGKKKMKQLGKINLPKEAFLAILKTK